MTKKDYIKLANAIKDNTNPNSAMVWTQDNRTLDKDKFINALCEVLKSDNPNFDADKFIKACQ